MIERERSPRLLLRRTRDDWCIFSSATTGCCHASDGRCDRGIACYRRVLKIRRNNTGSGILLMIERERSPRLLLRRTRDDWCVFSIDGSQKVLSLKLQHKSHPSLIDRPCQTLRRWQVKVTAAIAFTTEPTIKSTVIYGGRRAFWRNTSFLSVNFQPYMAVITC